MNLKADLFTKQFLIKYSYPATSIKWKRAIGPLVVVEDGATNSKRKMLLTKWNEISSIWMYSTNSLSGLYPSINWTYNCDVTVTRMCYSSLFSWLKTKSFFQRLSKSCRHARQILVRGREKYVSPNLVAIAIGCSFVSDWLRGVCGASFVWTNQKMYQFRVVFDQLF